MTGKFSTETTSLRDWSLCVKGHLDKGIVTHAVHNVAAGILKGEYHCIVDLLFNWFGLVCFAIKNKNCQLSYS